MNNEETKIPLFRRCVLQNFPFIEQDFDALTDYALLCKVVEYLNKVIIATNENSAQVEALTIAFNNLKSYVDNYFANLDVQEEINNKLDQMAEDGTLQEIITAYIQANVAWTFDTVAEMKAATNLVAGSYAQTLGFYSINDGGGALYYITDSGTADEMQVIAIDSLYANLVVKEEMNLKQFGSINDGTSDDSPMLKVAITSQCKILHIDDDIYLEDDIELDNVAKQILFTSKVNTNVTEVLFDIKNGSDIKINGAIFDLGSLNACDVIHVLESKAVISNCEFNNFKTATASSEKDIIEVNEGSDVVIDNCKFTNIKICGNGTIGDNAGTGRCILTRVVSDDTKLINLSVNNVTFENNWNIDTSGNFIIEDFDNIHLAQSTKGLINIDGVISRNSGKRVIKDQAGNINISNIQVYNTDDYESSNIISVMGGSNTNITNVRFKGGNIAEGIVFRRCSDSNLTNVSGTMKNKTEPFTTSSAPIIITGGINLNIANCNIKGASYAFRIWEDSYNIHFVNCNFETPHAIGQMTCRSESSPTATNIHIHDVDFINCYFKTNETMNSRSLDIVPANDGTIKNIRFDKCKFIYTSRTYAYGLARFNGDNCVLNECDFDTTAGNSTILTNTAGSCVIIRGNITNDEASTIAISGTAKLEFDHSTTNNNISLTGTSCSLISEYTTHGTISYASSATSAQVTELSYS